MRWLAGDDQRLLEAGKLPVDLGGEATSECFPNSTCVRRLVSLFLGLGILARLTRYYLCFPLWDDESFLCVNLITRSYAQLLQPLDYHQVAPVLFLWLERSVVRLLGFSEYALRLVPFFCSIVSLFLFRRVAERLVSGTALVFAVAIFAVSYPGIRYAAEAKPYGLDMFVSLAMLALLIEWQHVRDFRLLAVLAAVMPIALGLSYPAVFAAGGLSLCAFAILVTQRGTGGEWTVWTAWNVNLIASFGLWFRLVGTVQGAAEGDFMGEYWKVNFPPISQPWSLPYWVVKTHASDFLAYPLGGPNWASSLTLILCCAGVWRLIEQRKFFFLGLILCPAVLHFIAAALQKYPYGGHVKFSQYLAPMICCLAAVGISQLSEWRSRWSIPVGRSLAVTCGILAVIGLASIGRDLANPYKTRSDFRARAFAQSFWVGVHSAEEVVCLKSDLGLDFVPDQHRELSWSAHYLCNQAIEVSRWHLKPANFDRVSASRPLRCVLYRDARYQLDQDRLTSWLSDMQQKYELIARESIPFPRMAKNERTLVTMEYVDSFRFIPRNRSEKDVPPIADESKPELQ